MLKKHKSVNYLSLLLLPLLLACKKDDATPSSPEFRIFTNGIEITDAASKAEFLRHTPSSFRQTLLVGAGDKITFIAPDTAKIGTASTPYSVVRNGTQYLFYSAQSIQFPPATSLLNDMLKYKAPKYSNIYLFGTNYITKEVLVGYGDTKQIQLSCMQYYWTQTDGLTRNGYYGHVFNELNEDVVSKVRAIDTLAVRLSSLVVPVQ